MGFLRIHLVRHAETDANRQRMVQGQLDFKLNDHGHKQAGLVAERLRDVPFDMAFSSDLSRAMKTVEAILTYRPGVTLVKQKEIRERFMGSLQGKEWKFGMVSPNDDTMETSDGFNKRINKWWDEHILKHVTSLHETPREILVVSHGGVIGTLTRSLVRQQRLTCAKGVFVLTCANTSVTVIEVGMDGKGVIKEYGSVSHLDGLTEVEMRN